MPGFGEGSNLNDQTTLLDQVSVDTVVESTMETIVNQVCAPTDEPKEQLEDSNSYYPWIPVENLSAGAFDWAAVRSFNSCPYCDKKFPCHVAVCETSATKYPHPSFFYHCCFQCPKNESKLKCDECKSAFADEDLQDFHLSQCSEIKLKNLEKKAAAVVSDSVSEAQKLLPNIEASHDNSCYATAIKCPGCKRAFEAKVNDSGLLLHEDSYKDHCLRTCDLYPKVVEIGKCHLCPEKFLNRQYLVEHIITVHHEGTLNLTVSCEDYADKIRNEETNAAIRSSALQKKLSEELLQGFLEDRKAAKKVMESRQTQPVVSLNRVIGTTHGISGYTIKYPPGMWTYDCKQKCPNCDEKFPAAVGGDGILVPHRSYYDHFIFLCKKNSGIFRTPACTLCKMFFVTQWEFDDHKKEVHPPPKDPVSTAEAKPKKSAKNLTPKRVNDTIPEIKSVGKKKSSTKSLSTPKQPIRKKVKAKTDPPARKIKTHSMPMPKGSAFEKLSPKKCSTPSKSSQLSIATPSKRESSTDDHATSFNTTPRKRQCTSSQESDTIKQSRSAHVFRFTSCLQDLTTGRHRSMRFSTSQKTAHTKSRMVSHLLEKSRAEMKNKLKRNLTEEFRPKTKKIIDPAATSSQEVEPASNNGCKLFDSKVSCFTS